MFPAQPGGRSWRHIDAPKTSALDVWVKMRPHARSDLSWNEQAFGRGPVRREGCARTTRLFPASGRHHHAMGAGMGGRYRILSDNTPARR